MINYGANIKHYFINNQMLITHFLSIYSGQPVNTRKKTLKNFLHDSKCRTIYGNNSKYWLPGNTCKYYL